MVSYFLKFTRNTTVYVYTSVKSIIRKKPETRLLLFCLQLFLLIFTAIFFFKTF